MIKVFYNPLQSAEKNNSFSPSASKPRLVADVFSQFPSVKIEECFSPISISALCRVHDPKYVKGVLDCKINNGFGNRLPEIAKTLRWTSGSMYAAAKCAIRKGVAVSLTSGFHHASYDHGSGFCTFNGLMAAAVKLLDQGHSKIGILDLDAHYGDGTENIIKTLGLENKISHYTFGREFYRFDSERQWLNSLEQAIIDKFSDCDVVLYQAGADPHIDDPLGKMLTTEAMRERDQIVFRTCKAHKIPVAWNLAGGYQQPIEKVLELHANTLIECVLVFEKTKKRPSRLRLKDVWIPIKPMY